MYLPLPVFILLVGLLLVSAAAKLVWTGSKDYTDERATLFFWVVGESAVLFVAFVASCVALISHMPE